MFNQRQGGRQRNQQKPVFHPSRLGVFARDICSLVPYSQGFCHEKQENFVILYLQVEPSVIPARFWPESRDALDWIPAKGMPE
jgi:hypothetical protein